jgi:hypothetical protein
MLGLNSATHRWITAAVLAGLAPAAAAQWQLIEPPEPGPITSIGVDPTNPDDIYITSDPDGMWHSADGGQTDLTWAFTGMELFEVHSRRAVIAPSNNQIRYMLDIGGSVRRSTNGGSGVWPSYGCAGKYVHNWRTWNGFAVHPSDTNKVLAGGGDIITGIHLNPAEPCGCPALTCAPDCSGSCCFPCGAPSWYCACGVPNDVIVTDIEWVVNGVYPTVWAATSDCPIYEQHLGECAAGLQGVLVSIDDGQNWFTVPVGPVGSLRNNVYAVATVPGADGYLLAATEDGLWVTVDSGANWTDYTPTALGTNRRIGDVVFLQGPTIYIGTELGVYRGTWNGTTIVWNSTGFPTSLVTALGSVYGYPNRLYAGYYNGEVHKTLNGGGMATKIDGAHGAYPISTIAIKTDNNNVAYFGTVCEQGIFKGTIPTATTPSWSILDNGFGDHFHYVMRIKQDPTPPYDTVYTTEFDWLFKSTNAGASFTYMPMPVPPPASSIHRHGLALAPTNPQRVYVGKGHGNWGTDNGTLWIWRSDDGGATWPVAGSLGVSNNTSVYDIAVSPLNQNDVFAATFGEENEPGLGSGLGVFRSTNGGVNWAAYNTGLPVPLGNAGFVGEIAMRVRAGALIVYIATLDGVWRVNATTSNTWVDITPQPACVPPTPYCRRFESIAIDPDDPNIVYAGSSAPLDIGASVPGRIFRSLDGGTNWTEMTIAMEPLAWADQYRVRDIQVGPTRAYATVEGSGIYMLPTNVIPVDPKKIDP